MSETLERFRQLFFDQPSQQVVFGVGALFEQQHTFPLVLVNAALMETEPAIGGRLFPQNALPFRVTDFLYRWLEAATDTRYLFVETPVPLLGRSRVIHNQSAVRCQATGMRASVGPRVSWRGNDATTSEGFLTAGHVAFPGEGTVVERIEKHRLRPTTYSVVGQVRYHADPIATPDTPGYDFSVVELDEGITFRRSYPQRHAAPLVSPIMTPIPGAFYGAVSGCVRPVALMGALSIVGDAIRLWLNCWLMVPSGSAAEGDSGGAFVLPTGIAGLLVGGSRFKGYSALMTHYVQDLNSLARDALTPLGVSLS